MLSRTADNLYWMTRYLERAETTARLLEVGARTSLLPNVGGGYRNEWDAVLSALGLSEPFAEAYPEATEENVSDFLFFSRDNPTSVASCIERARENGRIVRTALTALLWDGLNTAYQEMRSFARRDRSKIETSDLTDWTTRTTALIRGAIHGTQLRGDGYYFMELGRCLELADNTARFLDVKYYVLLPKADYVGTGYDNAQWTTLLRAVSAWRAFNWAYGQDMTPARIAHFLILNPQMPRSLITTVTGALECLEALARGYGRQGRALGRVRRVMSQLAETSVEEIQDEGLHEFLTRFVHDISEIGADVNNDYLGGAWA
jgi:uncharacterized alpha-E superfamily protein